MNISEQWSLATGPKISPRTSYSESSPNPTCVLSDVLPLFDCAYVLFAAWLGAMVHRYASAATGAASALGDGAGGAVIVVALIAPFILYDKEFGRMASDGRVAALSRSFALRFAMLIGALLGVGLLSGAVGTLPLDWVALWLFGAVLLSTSTRYFMVGYARRLRQRGELAEVIAVVGAGPVADRLVRALRQESPKSVELLGVFDDKIIGAVPSEIKSSGTLANLLELGKSRRIDWVVVTLPPTAEQRVLSIAQRLNALSVPIGLCPQHVGSTLPYRAIDYVGGSVPVSLLADRPIKAFDEIAKYVEDLLLGVVITILLLPAMAIIALAIKLSGPGPVIFKQRRHAFNNREFDIYKFRTMTWSPAPLDGCLRQTQHGDERVTRVGRILRATSLDELPQLFNVLQGDMSLVGPRPHAVNMRTENRLGHEITDAYPHRHRVKPGITGWAQVNGARGATENVEQLRRRVELDLHYIENWSLWFDLKILALTSLEVIKMRNAY